MYNKMSQVFQVFALVLFALQMFVAGANFADNQPGRGTINIVLGVLWLCILLIGWLSLKSEIKLLRATVKAADKVFDSIIKVAKEFESREDKPATKVHAKDQVTKVKVETPKKAPAKKVSKK